MRQHVRSEWRKSAQPRANRFLRFLIALMALGWCAGCDSDSPSEPNLMADFSVGGNGPDVIFQDESSGAPTQWFWDFGDDNEATTGPTVSHRYEEDVAEGVVFPHVFIVSLRVCNKSDVCSSTTRRVRVDDTNDPQIVPF